MQLKLLVIVLTMIFLGSTMVGPHCDTYYAASSAKIYSSISVESAVAYNALNFIDCNHTNSSSSSTHTAHCHQGHCCVVFYKNTSVQIRPVSSHNFLYKPIKTSGFILALFRPPIALVVS